MHVPTTTTTKQKGTYQECFYGLMCLGIPHDVIPVDQDGELILPNHMNWLQGHLVQESSFININEKDAPVFRGKEVMR